MNENINYIICEILNTPNWIQLKKLGENKIIRSSYIWVILVPVLAKITPEIESFLNKNGAEINIALPFSWHIFYFSSLFFAVASYIYSSKCPFIIKRYENPSEYIKDGHGIKELKDYFEYSIRNYKEEDKKEILLEFSKIKKVGSNGEDQFNSEYLFVIKTLKVKRKCWRFFCSISYKMGFFLLGIVFLQNFIFVTEEFISNYLNFKEGVWP